MHLWWATPNDWRRLLTEAGFGEIEVYGWFDRRPLSAASADSVWLARPLLSRDDQLRVVPQATAHLAHRQGQQHQKRSAEREHRDPRGRIRSAEHQRREDPDQRGHPDERRAPPPRPRRGRGDPPRHQQAGAGSAGEEDDQHVPVAAVRRPSGRLGNRQHAERDRDRDQQPHRSLRALEEPVAGRLGGRRRLRAHARWRTAS